jgi:hypothetical protein
MDGARRGLRGDESRRLAEPLTVQVEADEIAAVPRDHARDQAAFCSTMVEMRPVLGYANPRNWAGATKPGRLMC